MARFYYFAIFALFAVLTKVEGELRNSTGIIEDVQEFVFKNPEVKLVTLQRADEHLKTFKYTRTFGQLVGNDRIVAQINNSLVFQSPQYVKKTFSYPNSGQGLVVSFVNILVEQTTNLAKVDIISGGIGQRQISILVQAKETTIFNYNVTIYGY